MKYLAFFRERPLTAVALCFGAGVLCAGNFVFSPLPFMLAAAFALLLFLLLIKQRKWALAGACMFSFFFAMLLCGIRMNPELPEIGKYPVKCTVLGSVKTEEDGRKKAFVTDVVLQTEDGQTVHAGNAYLTYTPKEDEVILLEDGTQLSFTGTVYHPSGQNNPYGFDFRQYLLTKGVGYGISCYGGGSVTGQKSNGLSSVFYRLRVSLYDQCRAIFGEESALPLALLLGYRDDLPDDIQNAFSDAGVAHILAVSGLHVTLLASAVLLLLKPFHLSPAARMTVIGVFLAVYCVITGFSAPVVRASLLLMIGMLAAVMKRRSDPLTSLSAAFLLILLADPLQLYTASFILSFSAVAGMIVFGDLFSTVKPRNAVIAALWNWWKTTFAATLGTVLPVILYFHNFSVIGLLINPLICALIGVMQPVYAVIFVIGCIYLPFGNFLAGVFSCVTRFFTEGVTFLSRLPFAVLRVASPGLISMILIAAALLVLTRYVLVGKRRKLLFCALCMVGFTVSMILEQDHSLRYIQLSLGQEDAALVVDDRTTVVVDTGENGSDLSNYLLSEGLKADRVVISHMHSDHIGGINSLLDHHIPIGCVYLPADAEQFAGYQAMKTLMRIREDGIPVVYVARGDQFSTPRATFTVLWPEKDGVNPAGEANSYATALMMDLDGVKLLSMTDVSGTYEMYSAQPADILKIAHHGSKNSTGEDFLQAVHPSTAILTCTDRSDTLPSPDTLIRLEDAGVKVFRTDETGALTVVCTDSSYQIHTFRGIR